MIKACGCSDNQWCNDCLSVHEARIAKQRDGGSGVRAVGWIASVFLAAVVGFLLGVGSVLHDQNLQPAPRPAFDVGYGATCYVTVDLSAGPMIGSGHTSTQDDEIGTNMLNEAGRRCLSRFVEVAALVGVPGVR